MALIKTVNFKGYEPCYWAITTIQDNKIDNKTKVILSLYKDKATRIALPTATITTLEFLVDGVDMKREELYPILKLTNPVALSEQQAIFFADAIDDLD